MVDRLRISRAEPGPPRQTKGVLFGLDERGRQMYVIVDRQTAFEIAKELQAKRRPVEYWTRDAIRMFHRGARSGQV